MNLKNSMRNTILNKYYIIYGILLLKIMKS